MGGAAKRVFHGLVYMFAAIGVVFVAMFFAIRLHLTNVSGTVDAKSVEFEKANDAARQVLGVSDIKQPTGDQEGGSDFKKLEDDVARLTNIQQVKQKNACSLISFQAIAPKDVSDIVRIQAMGNADAIVSKMIFAVQGALGNQPTMQENVQSCLEKKQYAEIGQGLDLKSDVDSAKSAFAWSQDEEWKSIVAAIAKDKDVIERASAAADMEPRLIVSSLIVEQVRLFHSQRELFKKFFEPLKILGNSTTISLGVMGIKPTTAETVEKHLKDASSPFYLGEKYEHLLDYPDGVDIEKERFARLTDENNHYWSYLYGAVYIKEMMKQWTDAGYDISYRPEIIGTLFNVGFAQSRPNAHPQVGGSIIHVDDTHEYSFGRMAYEFYYSGQLLEEFPYKIQ